MNVITIGRRLVSAEQIALIEAFDPASNPEFKPEREFKGRVVLLNRDTVLTETTPQEFSDVHNLRYLSDDNVAVNPAVVFRVETFTPTETFKPSKAYLTRLKWRDPEGNDQSKLLLTDPQTVIARISGKEVESAIDPKRTPRRPGRTRRSSRKTEPAATA